MFLPDNRIYHSTEYIRSVWITCRDGLFYCRQLKNLQTSLPADAMHPDMPYCHTVHEYGTALEGLMRKGFITIEDGTIACTPEGDRLLLDLAPYNLAHSILVGQYGADEIPYGTITGRKAVKGFGEWLTDTVTDIMRYTPKNK